MIDLDRRFEVLERIEAPDLWAEIHTREPSVTLHPIPPRRSRPLIVAAAAAVLVLLLVGGVALLTRGSDSGPVSETSTATTQVTTTTIPDTTTSITAPPTTAPVAPATTVAPPTTVAAPKTTAAAEPFGRIVFWSNRDGNNHLYVVNADGTGLVRITDDSLESDGAHSPRWSPNGTRIGFTNLNRCAVPISSSNERGFVTCSEVYLVDADGSNLTRVTENDVDDDFVAWSPDGSRVLIHRFELGEIYVARSDGTGLTRLASGGAAAWTPDGTAIVYENDPGRYYRIESNGTGLTVLGEAPSNGDGPWSPDRTQIAFVRDPQPGSDYFSLHVVNADGTGLTQLTGDDIPCASEDPCTIFSTTWSPDGERIAFFSQPDSSDPPQLYVVKADGRELTRLAGGGTGDTRPIWSPNGSYLAFSRIVDDAYEMYTVRVDGSGLTKLTDVEGHIGDWS